jgi:hypothetical protein
LIMEIVESASKSIWATEETNEGGHIVRDKASRLAERYAEEKGTYNWYSQMLDSKVSAPVFCKEQARPLLSTLEHVIGSCSNQN